MSADAVPIVGVPGSPYSRKLRAVLRYRRIPHRWILQGSPEAEALPRARIPLLPQLMLPGRDGALEARTDSTPLIRELEQRWTGRSVIPADPVVAFVDALLEDYADEWLTKAMFHYRWAHAADVDKAARILPRWFRSVGSDAAAAAAGREFAARQVGRLALVGSSAATAPIIEASYRRLLEALEHRLSVSRFVLGDRPGCGDFALYGQLTQLAGFDPTPAAIALDRAPRVAAWVDLVEDLSGLEASEEDWVPRDALGATVGPLLAEIGRVYAPFLLANDEALASGAAEVRAEIDGRAWRQPPFPYQRKCLRWLREAHAGLEARDRAAVGALLAGTGCEPLFA